MIECFSRSNAIERELPIDIIGPAGLYSEIDSTDSPMNRKGWFRGGQSSHRYSDFTRPAPDWSRNRMVPTLFPSLGVDTRVKGPTRSDLLRRNILALNESYFDTEREFLRRVGEERMKRGK